MRVLVLNANTNAAMTAHVLAAARRLAPDIEFGGATGRFGATHIGTRATYAIAAHAALDCYAAQTERFDAVILACFGDPGLGALQNIADVPVFGLAEAACRSTAKQRRPFSIVTGGERWIGLLQGYLASVGLTEWLASIRVVDTTGSQILADPRGSLDALAGAARLAATDDGAECVILGGAGLIGLAARIAADVPVPLVDCLDPAIAAARSAVPIPPRAVRGADLGTVAFDGIERDLADLLAADIARGS